MGEEGSKGLWLEGTGLLGGGGESSGEVGQVRRLAEGRGSMLKDKGSLELGIGLMVGTRKEQLGHRAHDGGQLEHRAHTRSRGRHRAHS